MFIKNVLLGDGMATIYNATRKLSALQTGNLNATEQREAVTLICEARNSEITVAALSSITDPQAAETLAKSICETCTVENEGNIYYAVKAISNIRHPLPEALRILAEFIRDNGMWRDSGVIALLEYTQIPLTPEARAILEAFVESKQQERDKIKPDTPKKPIPPALRQKLPTPPGTPRGARLLEGI